MSIDLHSGDESGDFDVLIDQTDPLDPLEPADDVNDLLQAYKTGVGSRYGKAKLLLDQVNARLVSLGQREIARKTLNRWLTTDLARGEDVGKGIFLFKSSSRESRPSNAE